MDKYQLSRENLQGFESIPLPVALFQYINGDVVTIALSDGFCELFGAEVREKPYQDMVDYLYSLEHPDDVARLSGEAARFATGNRDEEYNIIYRTKDRKEPGYRIIHAKGRHVYTEDGRHLAYVIYMDEGHYTETHTEEEAANETALNRSLNSLFHEENLLKANRYDSLTGLPSMSWFFEQAEAWKMRTQKEDAYVAFLFIDLCGMKFFNHKYGFAAGDKYLKAFAVVLTEIFGHDNCSRLSQDHFGVYTEEAGAEDKLQRMFEKCRELNGGNYLRVHVGIYSTRLEDVPVSAACDRAMLACKQIRGTFDSRFQYYDQKLRDDIVKRQYILENFDRAMQEHWIRVYYQPIIRAINGRVCHEEALARWIDPEKGLLSPVEFIPVLEETGLIHKLDLFMLDEVLEKLKRQQEMGFFIVSHSINLSRADFDACDIVEEIRIRVDASGLGREKIVIEITESMVGSDFDFMKEQVRRFQELGFAVWMDDFGSGYSSLDILQSIKFDLLKFDMAFMRKLNESEDGKIILKELVRMAATLDMNTICEGVETEEQVHFLQEIGCSMLQGFYYCRPIPLEEILKRYRESIQIGYEDPAESGYYDEIGRVNLFDLDVLIRNDSDILGHVFSTLPMCILEFRGTQVRILRSNQSYRDFAKRYFSFDLSHDGTAFYSSNEAFIGNIMENCGSRENRALYDEVMPDRSVVHSFARQISINPVTGTMAVAVAVLSITEA